MLCIYLHTKVARRPTVATSALCVEGSRLWLVHPAKTMLPIDRVGKKTTRTDSRTPCQDQVKPTTNRTIVITQLEGRTTPNKRLHIHPREKGVDNDSCMVCPKLHYQRFEGGMYMPKHRRVFREEGFGRHLSYHELRLPCTRLRATTGSKVLSPHPTACSW